MWNALLAILAVYLVGVFFSFLFWYSFSCSWLIVENTDDDDADYYKLTWKDRLEVARDSLIISFIVPVVLMGACF